jgi:muramidase (phage lysozyme)
VVDAFSSQFGNFIDELNNITSKGNYDVAPKLNPVKPKTINIGGVSLPGATGGGGGTLDKLMKAIRQQESNGNYSAYNSMYGASGAYQILKSNIPSWSREALGRSVNYNEFMNSPQVQDAIARYKLGQYLQKYGAAGAAVAWYGGPGAVANMNSKSTQRGRYPSIYAYWNSVLSKM